MNNFKGAGSSAPPNANHHSPDLNFNDGNGLGSTTAFESGGNGPGGGAACDPVSRGNNGAGTPAGT